MRRLVPSVYPWASTANTRLPSHSSLAPHAAAFDPDGPARDAVVCTQPWQAKHRGVQVRAGLHHRGSGGIADAVEEGIRLLWPLPSSSC